MGSSGGNSRPPNYPEPPAGSVVPYGQTSPMPQAPYTNFLTPNQVNTGIPQSAIAQMDALNKPEPSSPAQMAAGSVQPPPLTGTGSNVLNRNSLSTLLSGG